MVETSRRSMTDGRCFASSRVSTEPTSKPPHQEGCDVNTRANLNDGGDNPTPKLNGRLPFRERLGCSPSEACAALGIGRTLLYVLIAERRVEVKKLGRRTVISIPSLLR